MMSKVQLSRWTTSAMLAAVMGVGCAAEPASGGATGGSGSGSGGHSASGGSIGSGGAKGSGGTSGGSGGAMMMASGTCTPARSAITGVLGGPFGAMPVPSTTNDHEYYIQVNEWNATADQIVSYGGDYFFKVTTQKASVATNGGPTGYPSQFIGANANHTTSGSNLPKQVSALTTVPTSWTWDDHGTLSDSSANSYNAAYDVWFSTKAGGDPADSSPSGGFLMVWYHKPSDAQPVGSKKWSAVTIPGVDGTWDVWLGGSKPVLSYVSTKDIKTLSYDLNAFIKDAVQNRPGSIQSSWYLSNVFSGFEIWRGGVNLESTSFCVVVN